jgi:O-antigen/teichoic acid export membrane protein
MQISIRKIASDACFLFVLTVIGYLLRFALNLFLAHHLDPARYGEFSVAIRVLDILVLLTLFGTNVGASRFLAQYLKLNNRKDAVDYIAWNIKLVSISFSIMFVIALIIFILMTSLHLLGIHDIRHYHLITYILFIVPIAAVPILLQSFLICSNYIYYPTILSQIAVYALQLMLFFMITVIVLRPLDSFIIAVVVLSSFVLVTCITALVMNSKLWSMVFLGFRRLSQAEVMNKKWVISSSYWIVNSLVFQVISILDLFIVYVFVTNKLYAGYYASVLTIIYLIRLVPMILFQGVKSQISSLLGSKNGRIELQRLLNNTNSIVMVLVLLLCIFIIYYSTELLSFFGPDYIFAKSALIILTLGASLNACSKVAVFILLYADLEHVVINIRITQLVLLFVLVIPATYFYDINGTALATAIVMCIDPFIAIWIVHKKLDLRSVFVF